MKPPAYSSIRNLMDIFSERASMRRERQGAATGLAVSALNHVAYKMQGNATEYANDKGKKKGAANTTAKGDVLNWHDQENSPKLYHYAENSEVKDGILEIHAHGNPNSIGGFKDISKLGLTLYESSPSWRSFIDNGKGLTLELYSCRTGIPGGIAQKISSYYPKLIVKAPTSRFTVSYTFNKNTGAVIRITNAYLQAPGKWVYYKNGQSFNP